MKLFALLVLLMAIIWEKSLISGYLLSKPGVLATPPVVGVKQNPLTLLTVYIHCPMNLHFSFRQGAGFIGAEHVHAAKVCEKAGSRFTITCFSPFASPHAPSSR